MTSLNIRNEAAKTNIPLGLDATNSDVGFLAYISKILGAVVVVAVLLLLLYLIWGAIDWMTSGGDSGKVQKARDKMTQAVIGLIVLAASFAILLIIQSLLGFEIIAVTSS